LKKAISIICFVALLLSTSSLSYFYWLQEQLHEREKFASIDARNFDLNNKATIEPKEHSKKEDRNLDRDDQITFVVKDKAILPTGYQWEEKGREFSYKGMFYDIVSMEQTKEGWVIKAESDEEEAAIVANQKKVSHLEHEAATASKATSESKATNVHLNLSFSIYESVQFMSLRPVPNGLNKTSATYYLVASLHAYSGEITHPPEFV
jgi:hypothetical protein